MADTTKQFDTFKEAYCAAHRCRPERFDAKVFWRCLYRHALPMAWAMWVLERRMFQTDFEVVRAIGAAKTEQELQTLVDEFGNLNNVERSIRRGMFRVRINNTRLTETFQELLPLLKPPVAVTEVAVAARPQPLPNAEPREPRDGRDSGTLMVRRLKRLHAELVSGRPFAEAVTETGLKLEEVPGLLAQHKAGRPELAWLQDYLTQREQFAALQAENARLTKLTADLTTKLFAPPGGG